MKINALKIVLHSFFVSLEFLSSKNFNQALFFKIWKQEYAVLTCWLKFFQTRIHSFYPLA